MTLIAIMVVLACAGAVCAAYLLLHSRTRRLTALIQELEGQAGSHGAVLTAQAGPMGPAARALGGLQRFMPAALLNAYAEKLGWAGRPYGLDAVQFAGLKLAGVVLLPTLVLVALADLTAETLSGMVLGAAVGFFLPDVWLGGRLTARRRQVEQELPLFADLVATAVEAGLSLSEAVRRIGADAPGLVPREFFRAVQEMAAGKSRMQAWRDLMERLPGDDLRTIVTAIMQAEQYGTSVADLLRYQVQQIRTFKEAIHSGKILVDLV
ncbi:MAG: hypothetical protein JWN15_977 [Firmicutes bacterium]|nr:hypothetical protein [Bacillota bacterium]